MERFQRIDDLMQEGYVLIYEKKDVLSGCDKWLEAWEGIKAPFADGVAVNTRELDKKYEWTQFIRNYVQDLEMELGNAAIKDRTYHRKRIDYCQELLKWCGPEDGLTVENTRRAIAESYFRSGDEDECDRLYMVWLLEDPDWGWGYIGWAYCHEEKESAEGYMRAEELLLDAYDRKGLRDKADVAECLACLYEKTGRSQKAEEFYRISSGLARTAALKSKPIPIRVVKIGRNAPCPCGSGKKYKKCCGR